MCCTYDTTGSRPGEVYDTTCVWVCCTANLYCLNQEHKLLYKKEQIPNERLYRAHLECTSQWEGM